MFIGHLAAGYLLATTAKNRFDSKIKSSWVILASLIGGVTPDLDMFYFYLIDNRQYHHHTYWTHYPIVWVSLLLVFVVLCKFAPNKSISILGLLFSLSGFIHMLLDSIVGDIWWFAPFIDKSYSLFTVTARYDPWWLNFILHWSFVLEMILVTSALYILRSKRIKSKLNSSFYSP